MNKEQQHSMERLPRGIRNNNPFNIDYSPHNVWEGQLGLEAHRTPRFAAFSHPKYGVRAGVKLIRNYRRFYKICTVDGIIDRFAPPVENDTAAYKDSICNMLGIEPEDPLDLDDPELLKDLAISIINHECGCCPYENEILEEGVALALKS